MATRDTDRPIRLLHLSDVHFQAAKSWDADPVLRALARYIGGMACGDEDRGRLLLGRYQLTQTLETQQAVGVHWRIALLHHPWDYLAEFDYQEAAAVQQHCDLLLRGHRHKADPERVVRPDPTRSCLELAAGCVYDNSEYPNAFQWIELSPVGKRVRVRFRAWVERACSSGP